MRCTLLIVLIAFLFSAQANLAQKSLAQETSPNAKSLIDQAYSLTSSANDTGKLAQIIQLMQQAEQEPLSPAYDRYVKTLKSWAHNRRGEIVARHADQIRANGDAERAAQSLKAAMDDFNTAVKLNPESWRSVHNRGVRYADAGEFQKALADFNRSLVLQPDNANDHFNRGEIHFLLGDFNRALADYDKTIELNPKDVGAYTSRGHARFQIAKYKEALADYNQAVQLSPTKGEAFADRADAHMVLSMWRQAAADYRKAINLDNNLGRAYQGAAWLMATCPEDAIRNSSFAVQAANRAIQLDGKANYRYVDTLAAAHANAGNFPLAQETQTEAITVAKNAGASGGEIESLTARLQLYRQSKPFRIGQ